MEQDFYVVYILFFFFKENLNICLKQVKKKQVIFDLLFVNL